MNFIAGLAKEHWSACGGTAQKQNADDIPCLCSIGWERKVTGKKLDRHLGMVFYFSFPESPTSINLIGNE